MEKTPSKLDGTLATCGSFLWTMTASPHEHVFSCVVLLRTGRIDTLGPATFFLGLTVSDRHFMPRSCSYQSHCTNKLLTLSNYWGHTTEDTPTGGSSTIFQMAACKLQSLELDHGSYWKRSNSLLYCWKTATGTSEPKTTLNRKKVVRGQRPRKVGEAGGGDGPKLINFHADTLINPPDTPLLNMYTVSGLITSVNLTNEREKWKKKKERGQGKKKGKLKALNLSFEATRSL